MSSDRDMSPDGGALAVFDLDPEEQADKTRIRERPPITVFIQCACIMETSLDEYRWSAFVGHDRLPPTIPADGHYPTVFSD